MNVNKLINEKFLSESNQDLLIDLAPIYIGKDSNLSIDFHTFFNVYFSKFPDFLSYKENISNCLLFWKNYSFYKRNSFE